MEMTKLENEFLSVEINPLGAELNSLFDKRDGIEHMWKADPAFWPRKAPILFPCVGESRDGKIQFEGVDYPMGRHGFTRHQAFEPLEHSTEKAVFRLTHNEETLRHYPYKFIFQVSYALSGNTLIHEFEVINSGDKQLAFQLGGHPAFAVPFGENGAYSDYEIRFDQAMTIDRHLLNNGGLYNGETRNVLNETSTIPLSYNLFNEDALVFKSVPSKCVWIQDRVGGKKLQVDFQDFPHLGIWSKPGANYVCLEPWIGCADNHDQPSDFYEKDSVISLQPNETFTVAFTISLITDQLSD
jgi:galactose mutarotase-like enzyme